MWRIFSKMIYICFIWLLISSNFTNAMNVESNETKAPTSRESRKLELNNIFSSAIEFMRQIWDVIGPYIAPWAAPTIVDLINWDQFRSGIETFTGAVDSIDTSEGGSSARVFSRGVGAMAGPYIVDGIKHVFSCIYSFFNNLYFVAKGETYSNTPISDEFFDDVIEVTLQQMT